MTLDLSDPTFTDERKAREYFEATRWPNGPVCPHCGNADASRIYKIAANVEHGVREGLHSCQDCLGQFTVMTGCVMESSPPSADQVGHRVPSHERREERHVGAPAPPHDRR